MVIQNHRQDKKITIKKFPFFADLVILLKNRFKRNLFMSRKAYFLPEIKEFKEKGFVIVRNLFSELEMREVKKN